MTDPISVLTLGACLLHGPLTPEARLGERLRYPRYGRVPGVYTFGEMFQVIDVLRGRCEIPKEIEPLCSIEGNHFRPVAAAADFRDVDVVLAEPASPIDITFRGFNLNRVSVSHLLDPLRDTSREVKKVVGQWFRVGIMEVNPSVRAEAAETLLPFVSDELDDADLVRAILMETRGARTDVEQALARLKSELGRPLGIVNYIFQYMPDGRAISWPAGFHEEIAEASQRLDVSLFQPATLVKKYGAENVMRPDLRHYNHDFLPVMAQALIDFAHGVKEKAAGLQVATT